MRDDEAAVPHIAITYPEGVRVTGWGRAAFAGALAAAAVVASSQGHVLVHRCVGAGGSWADVAIRFAVLRDAVECPDGTLGLGAVPAGAVVLASVALPMLVAHVLAAAAGASLAALAARGVRVVAGLVGRLVRVPRTRALPVARREPALVVPPVPVRPALALLLARPHRAPPPLPA